MLTDASSIAEKTHLLLNQPAALAGYSLHGWEHLPRAELDAMHLLGLKQRFAELRDAIPMLKKLADGTGVETIGQVDDVVPLLFQHTVYKSYPPVLLENNRFPQINQWLTKLVTPELAEQVRAAEVGACEGLDDWFAVMDEAVPELRLGHSTGTSGSMSFLPVSRTEYQKNALVRRLFVWNQTGPDMPAPDLHVAYPYFRSGSSGHLRGNDMAVQVLLKGEDYFHAAYPGRMSSDVLYLGARIRAAQARGTLDRLQISPALRAKKAQFDALLADMPQRLEQFFEQLAEQLHGKRIYIWATWNMLHGMAKAGLARGLEGVFAPHSYISYGGGAKGMVPPPDWQDDVRRFTGVKRLHELYGMTEILGSHMKCEHGHFHFAPTVIPFLLDPETGQPLPREGRVTGRAAFFDLGAHARWGGFISGDEITVEWEKPCPCGHTGRYVVGAVQRYSEKSGGDDKITCAASESVVNDALSFLNQFEV